MKRRKIDRALFIKLGAIGGAKRGPTKRRGNSDYYRQLAFKRIAKHGK